MSRLKAPAGGCTIRMYRHGLGDCFLLAFGNNNNQQKYVLIDCGVLIGTKDGSGQMKKVAGNILEATGGKVHALAITHEHWDHVSGFHQAKEIFKKLKVDSLWLSWAEDTNDPLAKELLKRKNKALKALGIALQGLDGEESLYTKRILGVSEFFGDLLGARGSTAGALKWAKKQWGKHLYCKPGMDPIILRGLPNVRFFVLGPPYDKKFIRKSDPSSSGDEVYLDDPVDGELGVLLRALGTNDTPDTTGANRLSPFGSSYEREPGPGVQVLHDLYENEPWRKIENNWREAAGELALKLDKHTNNTSLVLTIELSPGGKVLLFTGDAQVGSWQSWDEIPWQGEHKDLSAEELLSRTVLYKVGHHGSHNATLSKKGLERMTSTELSAIVPVDQNMAKKKHWKMPYEPLRARLEELTQGRLLIADEGVSGLSGEGEAEDFMDRVIETELFLDITIPTCA